MPVAVGKKWSSSTVASKLEAFSIAGCNVINLNRTSQQKANHLKREICNAITSNLVAITGNTKAIVQYTNYEEAIVLKYGIEMVKKRKTRKDVGSKRKTTEDNDGSERPQKCIRSQDTVYDSNDDAAPPSNSGNTSTALAPTVPESNPASA
ncbi:hypothetical protein HYPSUDRAFT_204382 [Hypholoma sublateritium FD-334 SS-4]|uniref:Uncharacterized protein n=1 Tax=Hypholoma sublateritium (strain FD-334 SS-4) TaxID=945553 RepID=A0A0D2PHX1_HYPSF|nr:hypothetical protein HYPSUDRAFT_204382 [Hypholoma sublateritium FD-334 SS-4]